MPQHHAKDSHLAMAEIEDDWRNLPDTATRRRIQNRIAQRKYRKSRSSLKGITANSQFPGSNIRNRLRMLEEQISLSPTTDKKSTKRSSTVSTERKETLNEPSYDYSHPTACGERPGRKRLCSDAAAIQRSIIESDEDHLELSLANPFDLPEAPFNAPESFTPPDAISTLDPGTLFGLQTPSESLDCVEINTIWHDVPHVQEFGSHAPEVNACDDNSKELIDYPKSENVIQRTPSLSGYTTLHLAVKNAHRDIVALLLDRGGDINDTDLSGQSALHIAAAEGHRDVLELLIERGAEVALKDAQGQTPLHLAAQEGNLGIVKPLLQSSSGKEIYDLSGNTPLHIAIQQGHGEIVRLLLDNGADPRARVSP